MKTKYFFISIIIMLCHSCVTLENEDVVLKTDGLTFTGSAKQVVNLKVELFGKFGDNEGFILYSFDDKRVVPYKYVNTDKWDIKIILKDDDSKDNYYSYYIQYVDVETNTKKDEHGYKYPFGKVKGTLIAKNYKDITEAPDPTLYLYNRDLNRKGEVETSCNVKDAEKPRCINYSYIMPYGEGLDQMFLGEYLVVKKNGPYSNKYAVMLPNRTFVFITNKGNYVKFQLQSVHKDQPNPITKDSEFGYLTFRYFIQKDGTRNLKE